MSELLRDMADPAHIDVRFLRQLVQSGLGEVSSVLVVFGDHDG